MQVKKNLKKILDSKKAEKKNEEASEDSQSVFGRLSSFLKVKVLR